MNLLKQIRDRGLILDGAMSTALEKLGIDTNNELWTAIALEHNLAQIYQVHNLAQIYQVHMNYFKAGAQMAITDTYQANIPAFEKHGFTQDQATKLITNAVQIAKKARDDFAKTTGIHNYVAAS